MRCKECKEELNQNEEVGALFEFDDRWKGLCMSCYLKKMEEEEAKKNNNEDENL